ncbi:unnamed protein product, partial [Oikopleura dioica]
AHLAECSRSESENRLIFGAAAFPGGTGARLTVCRACLQRSSKGRSCWSESHLRWIAQLFWGNHRTRCSTES